MKNKLLVVIFLAFTALYVGLVVALPSDPAVLDRYHITQSRAHFLGLTIAIPTILIWLFALYGLMKLRQYTELIKDSREGPGFSYLSTGLMVLILSLPVIASASSILKFTGYRYPELLSSTTIMKNYITLLFPFIVFLFIARGAQDLINTLKSHKSSRRLQKFGLITCIMLTTFYTWIITTRPVGPNGDSSYYLPTVVILFTLGIPYVYIWCKGTVAAYQLYVYKSRVRGSIYRGALNSLALGIGSVIILSIFLQLLITISARLLTLNLSPRLGIVYVLVALIGVSYGLIARGSKRLKQIEEV